MADYPSLVIENIGYLTFHLPERADDLRRVAILLAEDKNQIIEQGEEAGQMSKPLSSAKWAVIFGVSRSTMRKWRKENKYPFVQVSERKWTLPIRKLPGEYLLKYQQHSNPKKS
ncbi:MAG TPA: hypothetical protein DIU00_22240 [Phycisphaerales bacterium]|nr:hypothetical protein [Phycisphaerales bacterium]